MILILVVESMKSQGLLSRKRGISQIPHEEAEAEPAWKDSCPLGHDAKEQCPNDRYWPDDIQEGRRCECGCQAADTTLEYREDQDIEPDDDQPNESNPPHLYCLSHIQRMGRADSMLQRTARLCVGWLLHRGWTCFTPH